MINTMRFSELNGVEEYYNTHLFIDWHACFEFGLQQLLEWKEWITKQKDDTDLWKTVPEDQKKAIERTILDLQTYDFKKPCDDKNNIRAIRNNLSKYNWNLVVGIYDYDGHIGILNGRMAKEKGHMKDLLKVTENQKDREREIRIGEEEKKKRFGVF